MTAIKQYCPSYFCILKVHWGPHEKKCFYHFDSFLSTHPVVYSTEGEPAPCSFPSHKEFCCISPERRTRAPLLYRVLFSTLHSSEFHQGSIPKLDFCNGPGLCLYSPPSKPWPPCPLISPVPCHCLSSYLCFFLH